MSTQLASLRRRPFLISISAEYFIDFVTKMKKSDKRHLPISDVEVTGAVDLIGWNFPKGMLLERVYFRGPLKMSKCRFGNSVIFRTCAFDQPADFANAVFENGLSFEQSSFGVEDVNLDHVIFTMNGTKIDGDLHFFDTRVYGCMAARRLVLAGDIGFTACTVKGDSRQQSPVIDLSNSQIVGNVNFERRLQPEVRSPSEALTQANKSASTGKEAVLERSVFIDRSGSASVALRNAKVTYVHLQLARFVGNVDLVNLQCRGLFSNVGYFACRPEELVQRLALPGSRSIDKGFSGAEIKGDLTLSGGSFSLIRLRGIAVSGAMEMIAGEFGQISVEDGLYEDTAVYVVGSEFGSFVMSRWRCRGFLAFHPMRVGRTENKPGLEGVHILSSRIDSNLSFWPGLEIANRFQAYLEHSPARASPPEFFLRDADGKLTKAEDPKLRRLLNRWERHLHINGTLAIKHCTIGQDILLTGVNVQNERNPGWGRIEILRSNVQGSVTFGSPVSYLASPHRDSPILRLIARYLVARDLPAGPMPVARAHTKPSSDSSWGARCDGAEMRELSVADIDLSGLRIREQKDSSDYRAASVDLRYANVRGRLSTFARLDAKWVEAAVSKIRQIVPPAHVQTPAGSPAVSATNLSLNLFPEPANLRRHILSACFGEDTFNSIAPAPIGSIGYCSMDASADIPGALDLQHSIIDELTISDVSFRDVAPECKATEKGIVLDFAKVNKLTVGRGQTQKFPHGIHNGLPIPLSLLDLNVSSWFLESARRDVPGVQPGEQETTTADPYLDLLDNDRVFRMSSYMAIERSLRDRGLEKEARKIFIAAQYRDARTPERIVTPAPTNTEWHSRWKQWHWYNRVRQWKWRIWRPGDGRLRQNKALPFFRLRCPLREHVAFVLSLLWVVATAALLIVLLKNQDTALTQFKDTKSLFVGLLLFLLIGSYLLFDAMRVFMDKLYWSLLDYGTSAHRLAVVILALAGVSLYWIAKERSNFEPTVAAEAADAQKRLIVAAGHSLPPHELKEIEERKWEHDKRPKEEYWPFGERVWMTLRHHVPLVGAVVSEEWQPADRPLGIFGRWVPSDHASKPSFWPFNWPRARDWFGSMLWINWILWPLFLPYLIRRLTRDK